MVNPHGSAQEMGVAEQKGLAEPDVASPDFSAQALPEPGLLGGDICQGLAASPQAWLTAADSLSHHQAMQVAPAVLAYIGDAVYELHVRLQYLHPPRRIQVYHRQVVSLVRAEAQAEQLLALAAQLTESEQDIVRRGRNAATGKPKRLTVDVYRHATGFEALLGYLYLTQGDRLSYLLAQIDFSID